MTYKRYDKYKDSGSEWIGEVPINWYEKKLKYTIKTVKGFAFKSEVFKDNGRPIIKTTDIKQGGIVEPITFINENDANDYTSVMLKENDILMSTVGSKPEVINSAVGQIGLVSKAYEGSLLNQNAVILRPKIKDINNNLLFYYLSSNNYRKYLDLNAHGTANQSSLTLKEILDFTIVIPDIIEQKQIADFLDKKTTEIDSLIHDKEKIIGLLKEERQSIITEAVTKGLDKNIKMKDSGVDWIGGVPKHWIISSLKYISDIIMGQSPNSTDVNQEKNGVPFLQGNADFGDKVPQNYKNYCVSASKYSRVGDILMSVRAPVGAMNVSNEIFAIGRGLCAIKATKVICEYLWYLLSVTKEELFSKSKGSTYDSVTTEDVKNITVVIPKISEQKQIVDFLNQKTKEIDTLIRDVKTGVNNLKEYKQSLISEVVTGKIDVRN